MERIAVIGRGGTGKTSFTVLLAKHFIEKGETPILLVDLDPDMNLAEMVGVDLESAGKSTISEILLDTMESESDGTDRPQPFPIEKLEARIWGRGSMRVMASICSLLASSGGRDATAHRTRRCASPSTVCFAATAASSSTPPLGSSSSTAESPPRSTIYSTF